MHIQDCITGKSRLAGLIGNPVEHSISPQLHNTLSNYLRVDMAYAPFQVEKEDLERAVNGLKALNAIGFNVTIPYKKDVMKYIDVNTKEAILMGAVNTVKNICGRLYGYNTDAEGFARSFKEESGEGFNDKNITIIGAGGASRAIAVKMAMEGAKSISIVNRTLEKAIDIVEVINNNISCICQAFTTDSTLEESIFKEADVIINTTSIGMYPDIDKSPVKDTEIFSSNQIVYDVIYNPSKTKFLADAKMRGCKTINGFGMLIYQGISAYEIWTGIKVPEELIKEVFKLFSNIIN
jgi:shikimate dehydrogenase